MELVLPRARKAVHEPGMSEMMKKVKLGPALVVDASMILGMSTESEYELKECYAGQKLSRRNTSIRYQISIDHST